LQVQELTEEVAKRLKLPVQHGVIVTNVEDNSIAAAQDISGKTSLPKWTANRQRTWQSFRDALNKADPKRGVLLYLDRKGTKNFRRAKGGGLGFSAADNYKDNSADQANAPENRREGIVSAFQRLPGWDRGPSTFSRLVYVKPHTQARSRRRL